MKLAVFGFVSILLVVGVITPALAQQKGDVLVVTVQLKGGKVNASEVVQSPVFNQPTGGGEYRVEVWRSGNKISERKFNLVLGDIEILPADPDELPTYTQANSAIQHMVLYLPQSGGTTDQYEIKVFKGGQEAFRSTLDKLPFSREAGVIDPIRSKDEVELLKKPTQQQPPGEAASRGSPWGFIIGGIIVLGLVG